MEDLVQFSCFGKIAKRRWGGTRHQSILRKFEVLKQPSALYARLLDAAAQPQAVAIGITVNPYHILWMVERGSLPIRLKTPWSTNIADAEIVRQRPTTAKPSPPSDLCGIFSDVQSSLVRQCLQLLTDDEFDTLLSSSTELCNAVRSAANKPKGVRVDARLFRRWINTPTSSNKLLTTLPSLYATEINLRTNNGEHASRAVGVRALLALDSDAVDLKSFTALLAEFRAEPEPEPEPEPDSVPEAEAAEAALTKSSSEMATPEDPGNDDISTDLDAGGIAELIASLREQSEVLALALSDAAEVVRAGHRAPSVQDLTESWNALLDVTWERLGAPAGSLNTSFEAIEAVRERIALEEEAAQAKQEDREEKLATLEKLRLTVTGLKPLISTNEAFRHAYEVASAQIADLELDLKVEVDHGTGLSSVDSPPTFVSGAQPESVPEDLQSGEADDSDAAEDDSTQDNSAEESSTGQADNDADGSAAAAASDTTSSEPAPLTPQVSDPKIDRFRADLVFLENAAVLPENEPESREVTAETGVGTISAPDYSEDMAAHVRAGRFGAAWLVAQAAGLPELDTNAFRLAAAAFHSAPGGIDPAEVLVGITAATSDTGGLSCQAARLALAATLRAALAAGWSPRSELETIANQANLGSAWSELVSTAVTAGDRNYQHLHDFGGHLEMPLNEVLEKARGVRKELTELRIKFARADKVLKYLLRGSEAIGAAFEAIFADTAGAERREELTAALAQLESPDDLISAIDSIVSKSQQRQYPIQSHARLRLRRAIEDTAECVTIALNAAVVVASDSRAAVTQEVHQNLLSKAKAVDVDIQAAGPGDVALARLVQWILAPEPPPHVSSEVEALIEESLPVVSAVRDSEGLPVIDANNAAAVVDELRTPRPPADLFDEYLSRGDLQEARVLAQQVPDAMDRLDAGRDTWIRRLANEVRAVRAEVVRTYADEAPPRAHVEAEAKLVTPTDYKGDRFDLQMAELVLLRTALADHRAKAGGLLSGRVSDEVSNADDRERINALIRAEDFVGANELLALARGGSLPKSDNSDRPTGARVFNAFAEALASLDKSQVTPIHDMVAKFAKSQVDDATAHGDLQRLRSWDNLTPRRGQSAGSGRQGTLASILRALGLDPRGEPTRQTGQGVRHLELFRVSATPLDGSLVPGLGSQATHYMVATTSDRKLLRETLTSGFPTKNGPNIVLFDGVLTMDERRQCLNVCRDKTISAIVVDHAVAAFVAARYPRSFRAVQQITLPFTCFTHYTVVAGNVPDEVFVGRNNEIAQLTDRAGSLFVYGGRQLGKSALLRKIQRDFNAEPDHHAIFIDLNSHGIGTWADPQQLWLVLYNELAKIADMGIKTNMSVRNYDAVIRLIRQWLDDKDSRRLLLLLDEADAFLEKESSDAPSGFQNIGPLKGLFDDTEGRFKPVFAGLHKVQRLQNVANTPLAHGGRDVLIGPLAAKPARDLVVKPLEALGYQFDEPESVWRLLAFTNLQPGLIQVVCNDLVAHLQSRPLRKGEPLIAISDADIDKVTGDEHTGNKIAEKLRLTIALEDRYRVIALAVAIMSMEDSFRERYSAADIREHCEMYWPQGFEDLNSAGFELYLDELIGLGVLIKDRENLFSVRSPNIVTMLGTKDQLMTELAENEEQFELPHEYNPRSTRRQVTIGNLVVRSPLSEQDLSELLPVQKKYAPNTFVIVGSDALGVSDVAPVLKLVGDGRNINVTVLDATTTEAASTLSAFKWAVGGVSAPRAVVVDASRADSQQVEAINTAIHSVQERNHGHLIVIYGPDNATAADSLLEKPSSGDTRRLSLEKWSGDGIRSWHDNPFNTPADRRELLHHSGGWPQLVERAVTEVSNGSIGHAEEWERLSRFPESKAAATTFLKSVGVGDRRLARLTQWAQLDSSTYESVSDIAAVLDYDANELDELNSLAVDLTILGAVQEHNGEYLIDPVVARSVNKLT